MQAWNIDCIQGNHRPRRLTFRHWHKMSRSIYLPHFLCEIEIVSLSSTEPLQVHSDKPWNSNFQWDPGKHLWDSHRLWKVQHPWQFGLIESIGSLANLFLFHLLARQCQCYFYLEEILYQSIIFLIQRTFTRLTQKFLFLRLFDAYLSINSRLSYNE